MVCFFPQDKQRNYHLFDLCPSIYCPADSIKVVDIFSVILLKQNKFSESLIHFEKIIKDQQQNPSIFNNYGSAFMGLQKYEEAKNYFIKCSLIFSFGD